MPTSTISSEVESLKARLRNIWMACDYDRFLRYMEGSARDFGSHDISVLDDFASPDSKSLNLHRLVRFDRAGIDVPVGTRHRFIHSQQGAA